jgi:hypothetical protein
MLPAESSLTYASDLAKHYREVNARFWRPPERPVPPPPIVEAEPVKPEPGPPREPHFIDAELDKLEPEHRAQITAKHPCRIIIDEVCAEFGVRQQELVGRCRTHDVARLRQFAMWRCRTELGVSLPEIGRHFGRDHSTVLYAVRKMERERAAAALE